MEDLDSHQPKTNLNKNNNQLVSVASHDLLDTTHQSQQPPPLLVEVPVTGDTDKPVKGNDKRMWGSTTVNGNDIFNKSKFQEDYFDTLPPGLRFCPQDSELITHYLAPKVFGRKLPRSRIVDVKLYKYNPEYLAGKHREFGEKEWYFFTPRNRKYRNGDRPNRAAGDGYWKATGADKPVRNEGNKTIGSKKALVFYRGKAPHGKKTNWIMHEYRVSDPPEYKRIETKINDDDEDDDPVMGLDNWVLCRIYKKSDKRAKSRIDGSDNIATPPPSPDEHHQQLYHRYDDHLTGNRIVYDSYNGFPSPSTAMTPPSAATYMHSAAAPLGGQNNVLPHISSNNNNNNYLVSPVVEQTNTMMDSLFSRSSSYADEFCAMYSNIFGVENQLDQQMNFCGKFSGDDSPTATPSRQEDHH